MCTFPVYTAQALSHSADNSLRLALGCMYFPGLSHSVSVIRYFSKVQTRLDLCFLLFTGLSRSGDQVFGERGHSYSSPLPSLPLSFLGVQPAHLLRQMLPIQNPKKSWLAMKPACSLVDDASLGPRLPLPALAALAFLSLEG